MTEPALKLDLAALDRTLAEATRKLLAERTAAGHWVGRLSSSALSTATAAFALGRVDRTRFAPLIDNAIRWLVKHVNSDGGWGDTTDSPSNLSTTLLCWACLAEICSPEETPVVESPDAPLRDVISKCELWLKGRIGQLEPHSIVRALRQIYGDDRTFAVPILTMLALAGRLGQDKDAWRLVEQLPFELAAIPHGWLKFLRLPVVSYALPALIAIGQARHHHRPTRNPLARVLRNRLRARTLAKLAEIQPASGGYLEAAPLTSFVVMCLASMQPDEADAQSDAIPSVSRLNEIIARGTQFLAETVRPDGSWPIDTNLSVWVTTLSITALAAGDRLPGVLSSDDRRRLLDWLLERQHRVEHPYTHAPPGGWAWTDLSGGVPDADDTAGALVALRHLVDADARAHGANATSSRSARGEGRAEARRYARACGPAAKQESGSAKDDHVITAATAGVRWLMDLQNRDGGIPTFCRGWGRMPFDRSGADLTAHALAAWQLWSEVLPVELSGRVRRAELNAVEYVARSSGRNGSVLPLWFGNQAHPQQENPTYGTARTMLLMPGIDSRLDWLLDAQGEDGGWGGDADLPATVEETALAVEAIADWLTRWAEEADSVGRERAALTRGCNWLIEHTRGGTDFPACPIGLYFAKLWYSEKLYPLIFTVAALGRARQALKSN